MGAIGSEAMAATLHSVVHYGVKRRRGSAIAARARKRGMAEEPTLTIGALAQASGVHLETIRYYQRLGLVPQPARPAGSVRRYDARAVARLRFIRRAQQLGFSLDEVGQLLALDDGGRQCGASRRLAEARLAEVEAKLAALARMRRELKRLIAECSGAARAPACPIIETLNDAPAVGGDRGGSRRGPPRRAAAKQDSPPRG
jgi:MerR family mercuric resistance operon transcriptional regulator